MTATGALIARHVTDLFPTQTSRFDLAQAARRGVIAPLRCVRIPPGPGVRTIAKVPLRRGEVDTEFDQEMLAELLDQMPFNMAVADLYKTRFNGVPGVVYSAGVRHAYNVAQAFRDNGMKAQAVSGETKKRELARILAAYERGDIDVLVNAQLLAEGWNSPRATVCMHLAPTASKRIYQQRVGRVTRRHPGKEAGIVVDFVHPATKHDDPVVTLHSLLDRDVYRGGAIVVGPVRRGRGRRLRVERRVVPVTSDENRRIEVFERELWRIAVEHLDYGEQVQWAALAGARVAPAGWRRARAMLHFDEGGELKRAFLLTAVERNKNPQLRLRALQEIAASRDAEAFDRAIEMIAGWPREEKREGVKVVLQSLAEKKIGRRDQANNWIWACAEMTREIHEEYAVQRWPETKRLLGLLVNSSGGAHARNARRLVHAARQQDRRLSAALLAAALPHTAEAGEVINGARTRMSRKPAALARELLRNFPKGGKGRRGQRRRKKGKGGEGSQAEARGRRGHLRRERRGDHDGGEAEAAALARRRLRRRAVTPRPRARQARGPGRRRRPGGPRGVARRSRGHLAEGKKPARGRSRTRAAAAALRGRRRARPPTGRTTSEAPPTRAACSARRSSRRATSAVADESAEARSRGPLARDEAAAETVDEEPKPTRGRSRAAKPADDETRRSRRGLARARRSPPTTAPEAAAAEEKPKPKRTRAKPAASAAAKPEDDPREGRRLHRGEAEAGHPRPRAQAGRRCRAVDRGGRRGQPAPAREAQGQRRQERRDAARARLRRGPRRGPRGQAGRSGRRRSRLTPALSPGGPRRLRAR